MEILKKIITSYENFPEKGILFRDILPILTEPQIFSELIKKMSSSPIIKEADALVAIDARGFLFGSAIALTSSKPLLVARKPGKLPGELLEKTYELEYAKNSLVIQTESVKKYNEFAIIDDLLATGGTINCVIDLLSELKKNITGISVVVELKDLNARSKISYPINSQITF